MSPMRDDGDELHGLLNVLKKTSSGYAAERQSVTVGADDQMVRLSLSSSLFPAGLDPDQARYLARKLYRMARLVEQRRGG